MIQLKPDASWERIQQFLRKWDLKVVGGDLNIGMLIVNVGDTTGAAAGFAARGGATPENDAANWLRLLAFKMREETDVVARPPRTFRRERRTFRREQSVGARTNMVSRSGYPGPESRRTTTATGAKKTGSLPGGVELQPCDQEGAARREDQGRSPRYRVRGPRGSRFHRPEPRGQAARYPHGNHVAGIIGAKWNEVGINGCTKFADLHVQRVDLTGQKLENKAEMPTLISEVFAKTSSLLLGTPNLKDLKVINISLGTNWAGNYKINPSQDAQASATSRCRAPGDIAETAAALNVIIVVSAGNDSRGQATVDAQWSCPFNWIAANPLEGKAPMWNVLVVEAPGGTGT